MEISPRLEPEVEDIDKIMAEKVNPTFNITPESQAHYLKTYSFGALVLNYFYYRAMGDKLLAWLSVLASLSVVLLPLIFIFPFWARQRAYQLGKWQNFGQFEASQKKWDEMSVYMFIISLIILYLLIRFLGSYYEQALRTLGSNGTVQINQVQNLTQ